MNVFFNGRNLSRIIASVSVGYPLQSGCIGEDKARQRDGQIDIDRHNIPAVMHDYTQYVLNIQHVVERRVRMNKEVSSLCQSILSRTTVQAPNRGRTDGTLLLSRLPLSTSRPVTSHSVRHACHPVAT